MEHACSRGVEHTLLQSTTKEAGGIWNLQHEHGDRRTDVKRRMCGCEDEDKKKPGANSFAPPLTSSLLPSQGFDIDIRNWLADIERGEGRGHQTIVVWQCKLVQQQIRHQKQQRSLLP